MKRIRLMLLAVVGALALSVTVGGSIASASGISFASYPAITIGKQLSGTSFTLSGNRTINCSSAELTGELTTRPIERLPMAVSLKGCSTSYEGAVTVNMNDCKFIYHPDVGAGTFDIGPNNCAGMTLTSENCTRLFGPQTGLETSFANKGSPSTVEVKDTATMQYTVTKGSLAMCGKGVQAAYFGGGWILEGHSEGGQGAKVVPGTGLFMTGKESGEASQQPKFAAAAYPVTIAGYQDPSAAYALVIGGNRTVECEEVTKYSSASAATASLSLEAQYERCSLSVLESTFPAEVLMNSCQLTLNALNAGPPYAGSLGVACSKEGDAIEIKDYSGKTLLCTWKIASQAGLGGISLTNVGSGSEQGITADFGVSGIAVTRTQGTLAACGGASQKATYSGDTTLHGIQ